MNRNLSFHFEDADRFSKLRLTQLTGQKAPAKREQDGGKAQVISQESRNCVNNMHSSTSRNENNININYLNAILHRFAIVHFYF